jgi:CubicO group peptidase (beta-lactamase class C family)
MGLACLLGCSSSAPTPLAEISERSPESCVEAVEARSASAASKADEEGWIIGSPESVGLDADVMQSLTEDLCAGEFENAHIVLVERKGLLVHEQYLSGADQIWGRNIGTVQFGPQTLHDLRSISKSVTSLLLGIALGDDFEDRLSTPIKDFFPEYAPQMAAGTEAITLHHVLTMTTGLEWNEMDVPYTDRSNDEMSMGYAEDPIEYVLSKPLRDTPGQDWYYSGGATILLAALVEELSGKPFLDFAEESLFGPLGISDMEWVRSNAWQGTLPAAASGLRLRGRDLAKLGSLVLDGGRYGEAQIVPEAWITASTQRQMEQTYDIWSYDGFYGYGYQWWHAEYTNDEGEKYDLWFGSGNGDQSLYIVPKYDLVVTVFAGNYNGSKGVGHYILERVLSAIE